MATTASLVRASGASRAMPAQPRKSSAPAANPRRKRPPLSSCRVVAIMAISAGWMEYGLRMHVPRAICLVAVAAAARSTGADRKNRSLETQI